MRFRVWRSLQACITLPGTSTIALLPWDHRQYVSRPAPHCRVPVRSYSIKVTPEPHFVNWLQDPHGNWLARYVFPEKTTEYSVTVDLVAEMAVYNPFDFFIEEYAEQSPFSYAPDLARELAPYLETEEPGPLLKKFVESIPTKKVRTIDFLVDLNARVNSDIGYLIRLEPGVQTPRKRSPSHRARAATRAGFWSTRCAIWVSPHASSRATSSRCAPT